MLYRLLTSIATLTFSFAALSDWGPRDYTITKTAGINSPRVITSPLLGTWTGMIGVEEPMDPNKTHELIFEFQSPNYFSMANTGHFAIGIRANYDTHGLEGRGIILGSVHAMDTQNTPCAPTSTSNVIAIEHFFGYTGNCVYGSTTESPKLVNNKRYRVQLISHYVEIPNLPDITITSYKIWERNNTNTAWIYINEKSVTENIGGPTYMGSGHSSIPTVPPLDSQGIFFTEVFSTHNWTFEIRNMTSKTCNRVQCTNL